jgi:hypothetical protein
VRISVNPDTEASGGFGHVEPGQYRLRVVKVEQVKGKKAPYLKWEFELVDSSIQAVGSTPEKPIQVGHVFENTTLSTEKKNSQFMLRNFVEGLGLNWSDFDTEECLGLEMDAMLKVKEYEGVFSNEIARVVPPKK